MTWEEIAKGDLLLNNIWF